MIEGDRTPLSTFFLPPAQGYRSANLLLDYGDPAVIRAYLPTRKSLAILDAILEGLQEGQRDRAVSLVAPYGSGKTSLLLFLSALLCKGKETQSAVREVLRRIEALAPTTAAAIRTHLRGHRGYLPVLLSGAARDLAAAFSRSLQEALDRCQLGELWHERAKSDRDALSAEASHPRDQIATVLERYQSIARALQKAGYKGLLVLYDEFGKVLEAQQAASNPQDLFFMQSFAELCSRSGRVPIHLILTLHPKHYPHLLLWGVGWYLGGT